VDLNHRPRAYESPALPLSYATSIEKYSINIIELSMLPDDMDAYRFEGSINLLTLLQPQFIGGLPGD
jgi:hypothetical protein